MSGGKGGSQTSKVEIPKWIEEPSIRNLGRAEAAQQIGYQPYYGPDVAAFTPMQQAAFGATGQMGQAFGLLPQSTDIGPGSDFATGGMGQPQTFAGGVKGYSSGDIFEQAVQEFNLRRPGQAAAYNRLFVNPYEVNPNAVGQSELYASQIAPAEEAAASTAPSAMQQQYQDQQNYNALVGQYTSEEGDTNWDAVNRAYERKYG